jgi:proteasome lid subunit RPN8/RPN11
MIEHAEKTYPSECCGLLIGLDGEERRVVESRPCQNASLNKAHARYKINPLTILETEKELAGTEKVIIGIYHSHPDYPASPSKIDFRYAWPWYSYLIVSVKRGRFEEATSWRLAADMNRFRKEEWRVEPS